MTVEIDLKVKNLYALLRSAGRIAIAFSGGVDSAYLLKAARDVLGDDVLAVTIRSSVMPDGENEEASSFCRSLGVRQIVIDADVFGIPGFISNPPDRCYWCKKVLFAKIKEEALKNGFAVVADGSNSDDTKDYRPGAKAAEELGIISPLKECGFTKNDIRILSKALGLPTWNKPSMACLASRFPYGEEITPEGIRMVDSAEKVLKNLGLSQYRVRKFGKKAKIEVMPDEFPVVTGNFAKITSEFMKFGFDDVILDPKGYRTGSMNSLLTEVDK